MPPAISARLGYGYRGINLVPSFNASSKEVSIAREMYEEFLALKKESPASIEYDLIVSWAKKLGLDGLFEVIDETQFLENRKRFSFLTPTAPPKNVSSVEKERRSQTFKEKHTDQSLNMAVMWFMVDALQHFASRTPEDIKIIAMEIAMLGLNGISPDKDGYTLNNVPGKSFSGYHLIAYYYVSWAHSFPDMLEGLNLPFHKEFAEVSKVFNLRQ